MKIGITIIKPIYIIIGILSFYFKWFSVSAFIFSFSFDFIGGGKVFESLGTELACFGIGGIIYLVGFIVGIYYLSDNRIGYTSISLMVSGVFLYFILFLIYLLSIDDTGEILYTISMGLGYILALITIGLLVTEIIIFKKNIKGILHTFELLKIDLIESNTSSRCRFCNAKIPKRETGSINFCPKCGCKL